MASFAQALTAGDIANKVKDAAVAVGTPIVIIGWIIAGILYLTSAGSPERTGVAKKAIVAAVIGTALVLIAATACDFVNTLFNLGANCGGAGAGAGQQQQQATPGAV